MAYKPYTGPAGPSTRRVNANNQALLEELRRMNIDCMMAKVDIGTGDAELMIVAAINGNIYSLGYDRWGYSAEAYMDLPAADGFALPDQYSWEDVIGWVKGLEKK